MAIVPEKRTTPAPNVGNFITELQLVAPAAGRGAYAFAKPGGGCHGFVQFIIHSDRRVVIHRLWTPEPRKGNGSMMMRSLCDLADRHDVEMALKVTPLGRKPYPLSREQLKSWYESFGFGGERWKLLRMPRVLAT
jgi:hypothetical protein